MFDLTGKNALVTGASGGIGGEIAKALHAAGATVALSGTREAPLQELAAELGVDATHMNIQIFRARKQLADSLPDAQGQQCLLERRGGKIRFGCEKFKIYRGDKLTLASGLNTN